MTVAAPAGVPAHRDHVSVVFGKARKTRERDEHRIAVSKRQLGQADDEVPFVPASPILQSGDSGGDILRPNCERLAHNLDVPVAVPAGRVRIGADLDDLPFGWDNELGRLEVEVEGFAIDSTPVRNREFLEFVCSGGYERREHWRAAFSLPLQAHP